MAKDCTKIQRIIYELAMTVAKDDAIQGLDDVVAEIRKTFPILSREYIVEAMNAATKGDAIVISDLQQKLRDIRLNARMEESTANKVKQFENYLETGQLPDAPKRRKKVVSETLTQARETLKQLRDALNQSNPALLKRLEKQLAAFEKRIADGDISPLRNSRKRLSGDKEVERKQYELDVARGKLHQMRLDAKPKGWHERLQQGMHFLMPIYAGGDLSIIMNQGLRRTLGHFFHTMGSPDGPFIKGLAAWATPQSAAKTIRDITNHPLMPMAYKAGFRVSSVVGVSPGSQNEIFWGSLLERLPILRRFSRFTSVFLTAQRFEMITEFADKWTVTGDPTQEEMNNIVNGVHMMLGQGHPVGGKFLDTFMWSQRLMMSHVESMLALPVFWSKGEARKYFAREYARYLMGVGAFLFLAWLDGWKIDTEETSSNFMGVRKGDVTLNPLGGVVTLISTIAKCVEGKATNPITRKVTALRGEEHKPLSQTIKDIQVNFFDYKAHPVVQVINDLVRQERFGTKRGEPVTMLDVLPDIVLNMTYREIYDVTQEEELPMHDAIITALLLGLGLKGGVYNK